MIPLEDLREAAKLLRERAEAAASESAPPWHEAPVEPRPDRGLFAGSAHLATVHESCELPKIGEYVASMHPLVGLALADAFEAEATLMARSACECDDHAHFVRLARTYLGRPS